MHMKDDSGRGPGVPAPLTSRRKFIRAAVATGGAGILSTELAVLTARGSADKAAQIVLPAATKDVTPFKVHVPQESLDDLQKRLATVRDRKSTRLNSSHQIISYAVFC